MQRPFRFGGAGDKALVYAHERSKVYASNVMGLGQERDFYGHPEHSDLDSALSATETKLAAIARDLLAGRLDEVNVNDAAALVSAISIRTKSMREAMIDLAPVMINALQVHLGDDNVMREAFRKQASDPKLFDDAMAEELSKVTGLDRNQRVAFEQLARHAWNRLRVDQEDQMVAEMRRRGLEVIDALRDQAGEIADGAFLKALTKDPETPLRTARFAQFTYKVIREDADDHFVLGDCGPVGAYSDGAYRLAIGDMDKGAVLDVVLLPLSPTTCLVGERTPSGKDWAAEEVNRMSASLSHRFFVSNKADSPHLQELRALINSIEPIATEAAIQAFLSRNQKKDAEK